MFTFAIVILSLVGATTAGQDPCRTSSCEQICTDKFNSYECECKPGYKVGKLDLAKCDPTEPTCTAAVDVVFAITSTDRMGFENYMKLLNFVSSLMPYFKVGEEDAQFGAVVFSTFVIKQFGLQDYSESELLSNRIGLSPWLEGSTETSVALNYISEEDMFLKKSSDRKQKPSVVVVFEDNRSNQPELTEKAAKTLKNEGVHVIVVDISQRASSNELNNIATSADDVISSNNFQELTKIKEDLVKRICPQGE